MAWIGLLVSVRENGGEPNDDHSRLRLVQFRHPEGFLAVPFFTSEAKARFAGRGVVRTMKITGRDLLEGTPGATFMLNPNDGGCVLYPEEIDALLRTGSIARIEGIHLENDFSFLVSDQPNPPIWLIPRLTGLYAKLSFVQEAYLLEVAPEHTPAQRTLLVALGVSPEHSERAVRASITEIQQLCAQNDLGLDITAFDPAKEPPSYLSQRGVELFYRLPLN